MKPVVIPSQRRADGSYNLKIRITYKRRSKIVSTNVTVPKEDVTKKGELKGAGVLTKGYAIIREFQEELSSLPYGALDQMDVDGVTEVIASRGFALDFFKYARTFIATKNGSTAAGFRVALEAFGRYIGGSTFDVSQFTVGLLQGFVDYVNKTPKIRHGQETSRSKRMNVTADVYLKRLKTIYEAARNEYNDEDMGIIRIPRNPFIKVKVGPKDTRGHINKSIDFIQKVISFDGPCSRGERFALDLYVMSFAMMGMNAVDFYQASPTDGDILIYNRAKTRGRRRDKAEMRVRIEPCIRHIVDRYRDPSGERMFNFYRSYSNHSSMNTSVRNSLRRWAKKNGEEDFTFYSARHSFASIAHSSACGIDKALVDECLCHSDKSMKMADVYISKDWNLLWEANRKVLSLFDWPSAPAGLVKDVEDVVAGD